MRPGGANRGPGPGSSVRPAPQDGVPSTSLTAGLSPSYTKEE
jgi:hypothetical protein